MTLDFLILIESSQLLLIVMMVMWETNFDLVNSLTWYVGE